MRNITINHPLRTINYLTEDIGSPSQLEEGALLAYRKSHDQAWFMKTRFVEERGNTLLESIALADLDAEIADLTDMLEWYKETGELNREQPLADVDIKLQIELRDCYLKIEEAHRRTVRFYDRIALREQVYNDIVDKYYRYEKPLDPLKFKVLDQVFEFASDMNVDVESLSTDLEDFLSVLLQVYDLLEDYFVAYHDLYKGYGDTVHKMAALTKSAQILRPFWQAQS
ncbi:MAG: hypothetical protein K0R59_3446 [Sphingobacterium sp.]|nr:hypothetical protein [Sphingobacterium sp.]